jgi:hypothetical protein
MKLTHILCILFAIAALVAGNQANCAGENRKLPSFDYSVHVQTTIFRGWHGAISISNGIVEAVVVPQIGRIMLFESVNQLESDAIFINKDLAGKTIAGTKATDWANFGGDKLWPSPQSDWGKHAPTAWPPDRAFDGDPFQAQILPDGVRLTGPVSESFGAHVVRTITMHPYEARLYIDQKIVKEANVRGDASAFPMGVWNVTQTRGDGVIFLPLPGQVNGKDPGFHQLPEGELTLPPYWKVTGDTLVGRRDPKTSHKIGSQGSAGWVASLYAGNIVFSEHYHFESGANYPDGGCPAEVYTNAGELAYIEMEVLGPLENLKPGQTEEDQVYWQLDHLPGKPKDDAAAARMVRKAMLSEPIFVRLGPGSKHQH